jgi:hypothetical protein
VTIKGTQGRPADLDAAIEKLYSAFSSYPLPAASAYSKHTTISEDDVRALRSRPLRDLSGAELSKFSMKALTTWGDENEFRHYLPRMLELVVDEPNWTDVPTLFGKLSTAEWRAWPAEEQQAIEQYVNVLTASVLRGDVAVSLANVALGASNAGIPLSNLVNTWSHTPGAAAVVQLASLIVLERNDLLRSGSVGHRWTDEAKRALSLLICSSETQQRLEEAFFHLSDPVQADMVSNALGILEVIPRVSA